MEAGKVCKMVDGQIHSTEMHVFVYVLIEFERAMTTFYQVISDAEQTLGGFILLFFNPQYACTRGLQ